VHHVCKNKAAKYFLISENTQPPHLMKRSSADADKPAQRV